MRGISLLKAPTLLVSLFFLSLVHDRHYYKNTIYWSPIIRVHRAHCITALIPTDLSHRRGQNPINIIKIFIFFSTFSRWVFSKSREKFMFFVTRSRTCRHDRNSFRNRDFDIAGIRCYRRNRIQ